MGAIVAAMGRSYTLRLSVAPGEVRFFSCRIPSASIATPPAGRGWILME